MSILNLRELDGTLYIAVVRLFRTMLVTRQLQDNDLSLCRVKGTADYFVCGAFDCSDLPHNNKDILCILSGYYFVVNNEQIASMASWPWM